MPRYRIEYDRDSCIGAAICASLNPENWVMVEDGKADMMQDESSSDQTKVTEFKPGWFSMEVDDITKLMEAAEGCPVNVIHIIDKETGKRLI